MPRLLSLLTLLSLLWTAAAKADDEPRKILIADPFIELHTGPGRGYPIFHVVERGREVTIVKRRTDWFQLRTDRGLEGWAPREQMIATLEPTGEPLDLEEPARENYMSRRWQAGVIARGQHERDPKMRFGPVPGTWVYSCVTNLQPGPTLGQPRSPGAKTVRN